MGGLIPQPFIDELLARADIVEVVGSRVALKKAAAVKRHMKRSSRTTTRRRRLY